GRPVVSEGRRGVVGAVGPPPPHPGDGPPRGARGYRARVDRRRHRLPLDGGRGGLAGNPLDETLATAQLTSRPAGAGLCPPHGPRLTTSIESTAVATPVPRTTAEMK